MNSIRHTSESVKSAVIQDIDRLFAPWLVGRSERYVADSATKITVSIGYWLDEELRKISVTDEDRRTQCWKFNRLSRTYDVWEIAAECINQAIDGQVERNRKPHRRWG